MKSEETGTANHSYALVFALAMAMPSPLSANEAQDACRDLAPDAIAVDSPQGTPFSGGTLSRPEKDRIIFKATLSPSDILKMLFSRMATGYMSGTPVGSGPCLSLKRKIKKECRNIAVDGFNINAELRLPPAMIDKGEELGCVTLRLN